jgi:hyperpolarization activated cyclic nucleotide-gated potassium channel 2
MEYRKLPKEMRNRITKYYEKRYKGKMFNEEAILNELSDTLKLV